MKSLGRSIRCRRALSMDSRRSCNLHIVVAFLIALAANEIGHMLSLRRIVLNIENDLPAISTLHTIHETHAFASASTHICVCTHNWAVDDWTCISACKRYAALMWCGSSSLSSSICYVSFQFANSNRFSSRSTQLRQILLESMELISFSAFWQHGHGKRDMPRSVWSTESESIGESVRFGIIIAAEASKRKLNAQVELVWTENGYIWMRMTIVVWHFEIDKSWTS